MPTPSLTLAEETQAGDRLTTPKPRWIPYDGQDLAEGDWINHRTWGRLQVTLATPTGTLKAILTDDDGTASIDLTDGKHRITHLYRYEIKSQDG